MRNAAAKSQKSLVSSLLNVALGKPLGILRIEPESDSFTVSTTLAYSRFLRNPRLGFVTQ